ncbi:Phosphate regulon sensor protein PhoR (SphS) [Fimbriimonas ginsengisoli Gsoil 348]|uniref:histidine kinase n=1 Tax=Fimbriimonas ginsengisoli Gsoil 348 TaxID=661478 RepID=A0A068NVW9_FIMGI|nr:Phosphate regulon sensor protein PhoR (SphS) [Fimbriimonas ginsengisoli Gsoil 348]
MSFGGAALLTVFAGLALRHDSDSAVGWVYALAASLLAIAGVLEQTILRRAHDEITHRQSQADVLQSQFQEQRRAVDELADGLDVAVFICDGRGSVLYANLRARQLFQFEDPLGRSLLAVTLSYDLEQLVLRAAKSGEAAYAELSFSYPGQRIGLAKAWITGQPPGRVFLSVYDVTDLRRLETIRKDFVANVSHELRTPMTMIRAMAETLQDEAKPEDELANRYLPRIIGEIDRLSMISHDLLQLSKAESNPVEKQTCDLAAVVREAVDHLHERAVEKGLALSYEGLPLLVVQADPTQMSQIAINLVENAINYTTAGSVVASVREEPEFAVFEVKDTGLGIAIEHHRRVFERFYRIDKGRSRTTGGTGLGLSIVKHIAEAHGGSVSLDSTLNEGSTFAVRIPIGE